MSRSIIANYIMQEYKLKQTYAKRKRENCKEKQCVECKYFKVCSDIEGDSSCLDLKSITQNGI